jgi:hypothetical protein
LGGNFRSASAINSNMEITGATFNIDAIMALYQGADSNMQLAGTWGKSRTPWRVVHFEPADTLKPACWLLEMGGRWYELGRSSEWQQDEASKTLEQARSSWKVRGKDGRWVPCLKDFGGEFTID